MTNQRIWSPDEVKIVFDRDLVLKDRGRSYGVVHGIVPIVFEDAGFYDTIPNSADPISTLQFLPAVSDISSAPALAYFASRGFVVHKLLSPEMGDTVIAKNGRHYNFYLYNSDFDKEVFGVLIQVHIYWDSENLN